MLTFTNQYVVLALDGNSNIDSSATTDPTKKLTAQLSALAPFNGNVTIKNQALGGATWETMYNGNDYSGADEIHDAFEAGKQNLLIAMETFNQAATGSDFADVLVKCKLYINEVKRVHPEWRIFLPTVPAGQDDGGNGFNAVVDQYNAYIRTNYADLRAEGFIEFRPPGGPFDYSPPYVGAPGKFAQGPWYRDGAHWSDAGIGVIAQYIADYVQTIPDVAPPGLNVNAVVFGNSFVSGVGASLGQTYSVKLSQNPIFAKGGVVPTPIGLSGSNITAMRGYMSTLNSVYVTGKENVLLLVEGTNAICNAGNVTGLEAAQQMKSLIDLLRTNKPWEKIILVGTVPRFGSIAGTKAGGATLTVQEANAELEAYDAYLKANWQTMGAQGFVDLRAGGVFVYPAGAGVCDPGSAMYPYMSEGLAAVHPNSAGYGLMAQYTEPVLATVLGLSAEPVASTVASGNILLGWL